jgi:hypothetical protein
MWGREAYARWAPSESPWSPWAKPTLFAQVAPRTDREPPKASDPSSPLAQFVSSTVPARPSRVLPLGEQQLVHLPSADGKTLIVAELPGLNTVELALMLAKQGYRPVPLFNATRNTNAEVPLDDLILAMIAVTDELAFVNIPIQAPPLFMLDAGRKGQRREPPPGTFDNRSIVFPQDFPSGNLLLSMGIENAMVVVNGKTTMADDLAHVLRRWQESGMTILHDNIDTPNPPEVFDVPRPSRFRNLFYRILAGIGLKRNSAGGFGARVPVPSEGGSGRGYGFG